MNRTLRLVLAAALLVLTVVVLIAVLDSGNDKHAKPHPSAAKKLPNGAPVPAQVGVPCQPDKNGAKGGAGEPGLCGPNPPPGLKQALPPRASGQPRFIDLSNNDPITSPGSWRVIKGRGYDGLIAKVNQGNFIDSFYSRHVQAARAVGQPVGGYDFVDTTRVGVTTEINNFVGRLKATGTCRGKDVIPPTLDVEFGSPTRAYIQIAVDRVKAECGAVQVYTGQWWWNPHIGCWWPKGVPGWISGYPSLPLPCGLSAATEHQYTDREFNGVNHSDASVFLGTSKQWHALIGSGVVVKPPSAGAVARCKEADKIRSHTKHPLTARQAARNKALTAFFHRNHLSCTRGHVRRVPA